MEDLLIGVFVGQLFLLFLDLSHELLGLLVLRGHDVAHAEVGQYDGRDVQNATREKTNKILAQCKLDMGLGRVANAQNS